MPRNAILLVGPSRNPLLENAHEPRGGGEALASDRDPGVIARMAVDVGRVPGDRLPGRPIPVGEHHAPALDHLARAPLLGLLGIGADDDVQVVAHHAIREHIHGEGIGLGANALLEPRPSMLGGVATKKGASHATADQMIAAGATLVDE